MSIINFALRLNIRQIIFAIYSLAVAGKVYILLDLFFFHPAPFSAVTGIRTIVYLFSITAEIILLFFTQKKIYKDFKDIWLIACICLQLIYSVTIGLFYQVSDETFTTFFFVSRKYIPLFFVINGMLCFLAWSAKKADEHQKRRGFDSLRNSLKAHG